MPEVEELVRCVGCCNDIAVDAPRAECPHCKRPIADSVRRWSRFVTRDHATVRGALLTIAIGAAITIPCGVATSALSGFVDVGAIQKNPMQAFQSPSLLWMALPSCIMLPAQFAMTIAWMLILFFAIGGVLYRVILPLVILALGFIVITVGSMVGGIAMAAMAQNAGTPSPELMGSLSLVSGAATSLLLYLMVSWAIAALQRSFLPAVPRPAILWGVGVAMAAASVGAVLLAMIDPGRAFDSPIGIVRVLAGSVAYVGFAALVIRRTLAVRRMAAELVERHRDLRVGMQPVAVRPDAPPMWRSHTDSSAP
ncbi:MAG: hypothetical protein U0572_03250 [Phycisphaerales bacterium]